MIPVILMVLMSIYYTYHTYHTYHITLALNILINSIQHNTTQYSCILTVILYSYSYTIIYTYISLVSEYLVS